MTKIKNGKKFLKNLRNILFGALRRDLRNIWPLPKE